MNRFIKKILVFIIPFIGIFIYYLFIIKNISGDIGALGYIPFGKYDVNSNIPKTNRVINCYSINEFKKAKIISIGDSFNKVGGNGTFSNYVANELNCDVYRLQLTLNNYKLLDSLISTNSLPNCKVLILESVERYLIGRLNYWSNEDSLMFDSKTMEQKDWKSYITLNDFLSFMRISINYHNPISSVKLDSKYFNCDFCSDVLFFYHSKEDGDLRFEVLQTDQCFKAKENLLQLKSKVESKGIKMIFVVAADKYDMYYDHIVDNTYGKNPTLDYFSDMDSTFFVNSKTILKPYLDSGKKDVYLANDTHWSPIAAEIIGKRIANIIECKGILDD